MIKPLLKKKIIPHQLSRSPWIYFLFLFSGIASLIYQIVWIRMLTLVFGHTILFRVDCLVSIYGRSWVGKLFMMA